MLSRKELPKKKLTNFINTLLYQIFNKDSRLPAENRIDLYIYIYANPYSIGFIRDFLSITVIKLILEYLHFDDI